MKRKFRRPLIGGSALILTIYWSGAALTGPPVLSGNVADPALCISGSSTQTFGGNTAGNRPRQDAHAAWAVPQAPAAVVVEGDLLAKASFPDAGPVGDSRTGFLEQWWLNGRLPRSGKQKKGTGEDLGGRTIGPFSLFLIGTGMFGLASFSRRWKS